jgi:ribosomal protein S21
MKVSIEEVGNNTEKMIKKFLKKCKKFRIVEDCFDRRYYVKPSTARNQAKRARMRILEKEKAEDVKDS